MTDHAGNGASDFATISCVQPLRTTPSWRAPGAAARSTGEFGRGTSSGATTARWISNSCNVSRETVNAAAAYGNPGVSIIQRFGCCPSVRICSGFDRHSSQVLLETRAGDGTGQSQIGLNYWRICSHSRSRETSCVVRMTDRIAKMVEFIASLLSAI